MELFVLGINFKTANIATLERVTFQNNEIEPALEILKSSKLLEEIVLVSTCNRTEIYGVTENVRESLSFLEQFFLERGRFSEEELKKITYKYFGAESAKHLFKVVSSLDSMVIGEPQIPGQIKEYYEFAKNFNCTGKVLNYTFCRAFKCAKRTRTETELSKRPVSIASIAVELAKKIFNDLSNMSVCLIGAGKMAEQIMIELSKYHFGRKYIFNRTINKARNLAFRFKADLVGNITEALVEADIIISSTASDEYILNKSQILESMKVRRSRPIFLIDISVPRDIDPEIQDVENIYLYNIDDLGKIAHKNTQLRQREAKRALEFIDKEVASYKKWFELLQIEPLISALNNKIITICENEISKSFKKLKTDNNSVKFLSKALTKKILHDPINVIKESQTMKEDQYAKIVSKLFSLDYYNKRN